MKLALYGGTFDPIHHGHLILAREARERLELDRVIFIPAARSPFKPDTVLTPASVRLAMVQAAVEGEAGLEVDDSEITHGGTSYTINTVLGARTRWPDAELWWLIGADHVAELPKWHRVDELRALVRFAVLDRAGAGPVAHGFPCIARTIDISATEVRARVAHGASIGYLVPPPVQALIAQHGLYQSTL